MSLERNIWILYPAGWAGNYVSWVIQKSFKNLSGVTDSPISVNGTSHAHTRSPTHQGLLHHIAWKNSNGITDNRVYLTNVDAHSPSTHVRPAWVAHYIMRYDPSGVIINIHDGGDEKIWQFGTINGWTKWPVQYTSRAAWDPDAYCPVTDDDQDRAAQWLSKNWRSYCPRNTPMDFNELQYNFDGQKRWLDRRNAFCPEDIPLDQYYLPTEPGSNLIEINLKDIFSQDFLTKYSDTISSHFNEPMDFSYCIDYHNTYLQAQPNLQWFHDWDSYLTTKEPTVWLKSSPLTRAFILEREHMCQTA